jgi:8-oxo-dGTP diphosphatase
VLRGDRILMVRHVHDGRDYWTLPGGGIEPGEQPAAAAIRELEEETHLRGRVVRRLFTRDYPDATTPTGSEQCFLVAVDESAVETLGIDPEDTADRPMLTELAWRPLAGLTTDVQVARVISVLDRSRPDC